MKTPFTFGKIAADEDFTDREVEVEKLVFNFISSVNTIIISPRRWGKSSLVIKAAGVVTGKRKDIRFCFIDLNNVRTEEQFYQHYATKVLKASSTKAGVILENAKKFMGRIVPKITFSPVPGTDFNIGFDWQEVKKHPDEIIDLPEKIAAGSKLQFVVCIDEFQNFSGFEDPLAFQNKMRSHWQKHHNVSYCLYGSKRHMMMNVFASPSMPF
ncbi:MAG: ATPase, partial [Bacteroidota bacterium]|nr:ATPase [Bacteroidota bacterium]